MGNVYAAQAKLRAFDTLLGDIVKEYDLLRAAEVQDLKHAAEHAQQRLDALIEQARDRNKARR